MPFDLTHWLETFLDRLRGRFGSRLRFLGLQGSYGRGEATEQSDIDLVTVLDVLEFDDLELYREVVGSMPGADRACGFICGTGELSAWPRYDLFQLLRDTEPLYGDLRALMPQVGAADAAECLRVGAANLYHEICHASLYEEMDGERVRAMYKSAFFLLRLRHYLKSGHYIARRSDLAYLLEGEERALLTEACPSLRDALERLMRWCGTVLRGTLPA